MARLVKTLIGKPHILLHLALIIFLCNGCAAALVGGAFYHSSKTKKEKRAFMETFNDTNLKREKAGLQPLDLCTEKYNFDEGWAKDDPGCKTRVEAYEDGDKRALGNPILPPTSD